MTLIKKIKDKKVNFEFNKEYIKVVTEKIASNDASLLDILSVTTFMYSLLNSKLTFLSLIFFIKAINFPIIQTDLLIHNKKNTIYK